MPRTILIAGAGIAGLTLAYWLNRYGYRVTVVETYQGLRKGGAAIDVRGDALQVAERMQILDKIKTKKITTGLEFVNVNNELIVTLPNFGENNADIELHRDHLAEIIYQAVGGDVEYLFNNRITAISQDDEKVTVGFEKSPDRHFDLVFGADGVHSSVRKLIFGAEANFNHYFGAYFAILKKDDSLGKTNNGRMYNLPGRMAAISDGGNSMLLFRSPKLQYNYKNDVQQKQILIESFAGCGWQIPAIVSAMAASRNLYFDEVCQIKMQSWVKGRIALAGDAAYCPGFPTGMGTSLAMQGAAILADELAETNNDHNLAFAKYNSAFHPVVEAIQATIMNGLDFLVPETQEAIAARNKMLNQ